MIYITETGKEILMDAIYETLKDDRIVNGDMSTREIIDSVENTALELGELIYYGDCFEFLESSEIVDFEDAIDVGCQEVCDIANFYLSEEIMNVLAMIEKFIVEDEYLNAVDVLKNIEILDEFETSEADENVEIVLTSGNNKEVIYRM